MDEALLGSASEFGRTEIKRSKKRTIPVSEWVANTHDGSAARFSVSSSSGRQQRRRKRKGRNRKCPAPPETDHNRVTQQAPNPRLSQSNTILYSDDVTEHRYSLLLYSVTHQRSKSAAFCNPQRYSIATVMWEKKNFEAGKFLRDERRDPGKKSLSNALLQYCMAHLTDTSIT